MDTRKVAMEYRLGQWAQIIQSRISSGQSIKEFCETRGVSKNTYFYWQRKLRETACNEFNGKEPESEKSLIPSGWSRLEAQEVSMGEDVLIIEVSGCRITATAKTDTELLAKVCRMLKSL